MIRDISKIDPNLIHSIHKKGFNEGQKHSEPSPETVKFFDKIYRHTEIINSELGETRDEVRYLRENLENVKITISMIETDVSWIKRFFWIIATASIGALITGIFNLLV